MKLSLACAALLALASAVHVDDKPVVYNHSDTPPSQIDRQVATALAPHFTVIDVAASDVYVPPKALAGSLPSAAKSETGEALSGYVLVAYVITIEGRASDAVVVETTNPRLEPFATGAMSEWRFTPGSVNGKVVATAAAQEFDFVSDVHVAPTEFVTQVLEPTGGKIDRPKDWFYLENHDEHSFNWIISRERAAHGYETGVRIQTIVGVQKNAGKAPRQFVLDFLADKKKASGLKVLKSFEESPQGIFTRVGLETEEGDAHVLYSLFWATSGADLAVVSIAGTRKDLWSIYAPTFERMGHFELIDMTRFPK